MRYLKPIVMFLLAALAFGVKAQNGINTPYSQYGIGLSHLPYNMPYAAQLGGVVYTRSASNMVNPFNPASYAAIQSQSFVFDMGMNIDMVSQTDKSNSFKDADGNIGYIAIAFPVAKWFKTSFGLLPMTNVSYESVRMMSDSLYGSMKNIYDGAGGVSRLYWGAGFNITKDLSAGFNVNYLTGSISRAITYDFLNNDTSNFIDSRRGKNTTVHNVTFDFGLQYRHDIGKDYAFGCGLTFVPHQKLSITDNALIYTFVTSQGFEYMRDTIFPGPGQESEYESTLEQPMKVGLGLNFQKNNYWNIAFDATYASFGGMKYVDERNIFGSTAVEYNNAISTALGFQLLGNPDATKYMRRITYSTGFHYESGKLCLKMADNQAHSLNEWGIGLGATLPMRKGRSALTLSLSYNNFGTAELLRRESFSFGISVGSCESWFMKRKYN